MPERFRVMLKVLLAASACLLLIACMNLANLLLARAMVRRRELAVRTALGAGRERLVRQVLTESITLAVPGGALGLLLAYFSLPLLVRLVPVSLPLAEVPSPDARVLLFAALVTFITGIGFGVIPALRTDATSGADLGGRSSMGARRERLRAGLVISEICCSVVLLVGFGLLTRALLRIQAVNPGFRPDHVLTLRTQLPMRRYEKPETREPFYRDVLQETVRIPRCYLSGLYQLSPDGHGGGIWPVEIVCFRQGCVRLLKSGDVKGSA
jgi:FtsX-like permease family